MVYSRPMPPATASLAEVAQVIQLAVAPIFLLTGVAATLTVFLGRLARIVDRGRALEKAAAPEANVKDELRLLEQRARLIYIALSLGVSAAILISLLMAVAFMGEIFHLSVGRPVALAFLLALFAYTAALVCLLREVFLALGSFRLGLKAKS